MKRDEPLRPLGDSMNDCYTRDELNAALRALVFRRGRDMDIPLLREVLLALDGREDAQAAPHAERVWNRVREGLDGTCRAAFGLTRRGLALLIAALVLLITATALAVSNWSALVEWVYRLERDTPVDRWTLAQKQQVADSLREIGYNMEDLPDLTPMNDRQRERALTDWLRAQFSGEVNSAACNLVMRLKGFYDGWPLADKAWFSALLLRGGEIGEGEFVNTVPRRGFREAERAQALAQNALEAAYAGTDVDPAALTPYLFYGYFYPDDSSLSWRIQFRDEHLASWFTVLVPDTDPARYEAQVVYKRPLPQQTAATEDGQRPWERQAALEAGRGPIITWTFAQQAAFYPEHYAVPGPEDITFEQACDIARDAYCDYLAVPREEADKLFCYAYFVRDGEKPYYAVSFFYDRDAGSGPAQCAEVYGDGTLKAFYGQPNG